MKVVRTPDERFDALPGYPFAPHYVEVQSRVPGAQGQPHTTIRDGGHFLQEDKGEELARVAIDFITATPSNG